jgi:hypothetical protein
MRIRLKPMLVMFAGLLMMTGCSHEIVNVPDHSAIVGVVELNEAAQLRQKTGVHVLGSADQRPTIDLWYKMHTLPPGDAFQRIPLPIDSPDADTVGYNVSELAEGTPILFNSVAIYSNCHVYGGRVLSGDLQNVHLLLVLPNGNRVVPNVEELRDQDGAYLAWIAASTTRENGAKQ